MLTNLFEETEVRYALVFFLKPESLKFVLVFFRREVE